MKKIQSLAIILLLFSSVVSAQLTVSNLLTENLVDPVGIDALQPRFSWQLISDKRNTIQSAYEIKVMLNKQTVWGSGKVISDSSVHVAYKGSALQSGKKYTWQARTWSNNNEE